MQNFRFEFDKFVLLDLLLGSVPLVVSFFVLIIFAANSRPVDFCTHRLTIENAPLQGKIVIKKYFFVFVCVRYFEMKSFLILCSKLRCFTYD